MLARLILSVLLVTALSLATCAAAEPPGWIGYTEFRTNLPGGRHANVRTMRAAVVRADGTGRRLIAPELADEADAWTQFAGWSPDGRAAIIGRGWQDPENARWEEEHRTFRMIPGRWLYDSYLVDFETGATVNVTAVERVSHYNSGLFFWPDDPDHLGFTALIDGVSRPFRMDSDGRNKVDLSRGADEFTYGFSSSPDGSRIAYHKNYQVYLANGDGSEPIRIETGHPFNFGPVWSPDGRWVLFLSGQHENCHPYNVRSDGKEFRKLADRGGYRGVIAFLDVHDFHDGSSDLPVWAADGQSVFYTAMVDEAVELHRVTLDGTVVRLTRSSPGTLHYHPQPAADGEWLVYGSLRDGVRQLYVRRLSDGEERQITDCAAGTAAMWPHWRPAP